MPPPRLNEQPPPASTLPGPLALLDPRTKGGIVFWSIVAIAVPWRIHDYLIDSLGWDMIFVNNLILIFFVGFGGIAWTVSYVFRVANKDMTYAQQLKDYENAVIQKRFEELSEEEVGALMGEAYEGGERPAPPTPPSAAGVAPDDLA